MQKYYFYLKSPICGCDIEEEAVANSKEDFFNWMKKKYPLIEPEFILENIKEEKWVS